MVRIHPPAIRFHKIFLVRWRRRIIIIRPASSYLLVILLHQALDHTEIGLRALIFCHLVALTAIFPVHCDYNQDQTGVKEDEYNQLENDHIVALVIVRIVAV